MNRQSDRNEIPQNGNEVPRSGNDNDPADLTDVENGVPAMADALLAAAAVDEAPESDIEAVAPRERSMPRAEADDDHRLVARFRGGDESAFNAIVARYRNRLFRTAESLVGNEEDALDISQDAFAKAYFNLKSFREDSSLYTWLYRIVYNLSISHIRRKRIVSFISFDRTEEPMEFDSKEPGPAETTERKEVIRAVNDALAELPPKQRAVFTFRQIDGLAHNEIAKIMGITEGAVKASYFHAVRKLRHLLKQYGEGHESR
jgi:RNA polymerase sigma-70 factor, ECF subfamily